MSAKAEELANRKNPLNAGAIVNAVRIFGRHVVWLGFLLLPSWASADSPGPKQCAEALFNRTAGRGDHLFVRLRLEDGRELPFMVDTGAPTTVLDTSLEPGLGKVLGTNIVEQGWGGYRTNHIFDAPRLYLGDVELRRGNRISVNDVRSTYPAMGILARDYLRHCRVQLDFSQCKISLLTPEQLQTNISGDTLQFSLDIGTNLLGKSGRTMADTGDYQDGALDAKTFQIQLQAQSRGPSTQKWADASDKHHRQLHLPEITFENHTYTNLVLGDCAFSSDPKMNLIGLRFLARHLVIFDFPNNRVYLKQNSVGPLVDPEVDAGLNFLRNLKRNNRAPGFLNDDKGSIGRHHYEAGLFAGTYPVSITYDAKKQNDNSIYHYTVSHNAADSLWILQKAWQTDQEGQTIKSFPVSSSEQLTPTPN